MEVPVEFYEGQPVSIVFPEIVEVKVQTTAQPVHQQQDNTYKEATLENGDGPSKPATCIRSATYTRVSGKLSGRRRHQLAIL
jgi:hypothetical protein